MTITKSANLLRDTYEIYAKMLAVENIAVVFDEAITAPAQFDILNRVLYISPVHSSQAHLVPGLVIHEVGHALFSILTEAEAKKIRKISRLLNIIDDGYQERMMCKKYPNSKKHLFLVFKEFFLDIGDAQFNNANKLVSILNILNFNCKGLKHNHFKKYPSYVLPEDLKLLKEAEILNMPSMMDRWEFSKILAAALKKYGEVKDGDTDIASKKQKTGESSQADKSDDKESSEEADEAEAEEAESGDSDSDEEPSDDGETDNSESLGKAGGKSSDPTEDELDDYMDSDNLIDHHKQFEHKMNGQTTYELPSGKELLAMSNVVDVYEKGSDLDNCLDDPNNYKQLELFKNGVKEAKKVANRIFTQFNMRVQAANFANARFKNSGMLDPERAALYQVYDDVFMKTAIENNQPNHAYSIVLDWSGSMDGSIMALTYRIMELVYFAKSAGIEIEVWLYTTGGYKPKMDGIKKNIAVMGSKFIHVLNTKHNSAMELDGRIKALWTIANQQGYHRIGSSINGMSVFGTKGTNILEGLILGHEVLSKMTADKKICFILTDGEDSFNFEHFYNAKAGTFSSKSGSIYINGANLEVLYKGRGQRESASMAVSDMYNGIGQKTIGVAWNCSGTHMKKYCESVIVGSGKSTRSWEYIHADNVFIKEIIKNLL